MNARRALAGGEVEAAGGRAAIVVYHPQDVERIARERNPDAPAFVLPADDKPAAHTSKAVAVRQATPEQFLQTLVAAVSERSQTSQTAGVHLAERLYLTLAEAAEYTGLGIDCLRRLIAEGKLKPWKGGGPHGADVLRRADLEKI